MMRKHKPEKPLHRAREVSISVDYIVLIKDLRVRISRHMRTRLSY